MDDIRSDDYDYIVDYEGEEYIDCSDCGGFYDDDVEDCEFVCIECV